MTMFDPDWCGWRRLCTLTLCLIILMLLSACTLLSEPDSPDSEEPPIDVRAHLTARLTETRQAQAAALALWDRVIVGESVSCIEALAVPEAVVFSERDLHVHPDAAAIQAQLNAAIQAIRNSADLWNIECADTRPYVPLSLAQEGRATALAASEPLAEAERLLARLSP